MHLVTKVQLTTIPKYDEMFGHRNKLTSNTRQEKNTASPALKKYGRVHKRCRINDLHTNLKFMSRGLRGGRECWAL